jgi:hypothetical protein
LPCLVPWRAIVAASSSSSNPINMSRMADRLRELIDLVLTSLDEPAADASLLAHVLSYGAIRRETLAGVLAELGARVPSSGDPIEWEAGR